MLQFRQRETRPRGTVRGEYEGPGLGVIFQNKYFPVEIFLSSWGLQAVWQDQSGQSARPVWPGQAVERLKKINDSSSSSVCYVIAEILCNIRTCCCTCHTQDSLHKCYRQPASEQSVSQLICTPQWTASLVTPQSDVWKWSMFVLSKDNSPPPPALTLPEIFYLHFSLLLIDHLNRQGLATAQYLSG